MMDVFGDYFLKLEKLYRDEFGTLPTVTYTHALRKDLLCGKENEDGEIAWRPISQCDPVDWDMVESYLRFQVNDELRTYYSRYYFFYITGSVSGFHVRLYGVGGTRVVSADIKQHFVDGRYDFPSSEIFLIGEASNNGNDDYFVYYNNETREVFCFDREKKKKITVASSLRELFVELQVEY